MQRILISVGGHGLSILAATADGQLDGTGMGNRPGRTLVDAIREFDSHPNLVLVEDNTFHTGYYRIVQAHGPGGCCWTYRLELVMSRTEAAEIHDGMVKNVQRNEPVVRSGLALAFDRLAALKG